MPNLDLDEKVTLCHVVVLTFKVTVKASDQKGTSLNLDLPDKQIRFLQ